MVPRVKSPPTRFPTNSLYNPMGNTHLHSISSVYHPCVVPVVFSDMLQFSIHSDVWSSQNSNSSSREGTQRNYVFTRFSQGAH